MQMRLQQQIEPMNLLENFRGWNRACGKSFKPRDRTRVERIKSALKGTCGHESWRKAQRNHHVDAPAEDEGDFDLSAPCRAADP